MKREVRFSLITRNTPHPVALGTFAAGAPVRPFGVGSAGEWRVDALGVAPVHFFLCFDGNALFAASAPGVEPARLDGSPLATRWVELPDRCVLTCGEARLIVQTLTMAPAAPLPPWQAHSTQTMRLPPKRAVLAEPLDGPTVIVKGQTLDKATLVIPNAARPSAGQLLAQTRVAPPSEALLKTMGPGAPAKPPHEPLATTVIDPAEVRARAGLAPAAAAAPSEVKVERNAVTARRPGALVGRVKAEWRAASPARRAIMILGPIALVAFGWSELRAQPGPLPVATSVVAPAHNDAATDVTERAAPAITAADVHAPAAPEIVSPARAPNDAPDASAPTAERAAVDAVAQGDFAGAARIYEGLATSNPGSSVYPEAARIARRKAGGGR
jgi:hypothetical protein